MTDLLVVFPSRLLRVSRRGESPSSRPPARIPAQVSDDVRPYPPAASGLTMESSVIETEAAMYGARHPWWAAAGVAAVAEAGLIRLGRSYGSTAAERRRLLPGDEIIAVPAVQTDHAVTIAAPPSAVWPWLVQMGWGRGGWYTARWVDRLLFPANGPSADRIEPACRTIEVGTFIPDGPPETECGLTVVRLEPERALVLRSDSHLPLELARPCAARLDVGVRPRRRWTAARATRFHFRSPVGDRPLVAHAGWLAGRRACRLRDVARHAPGRAAPGRATGVDPGRRRLSEVSPGSGSSRARREPGRRTPATSCR